MRCSAPRIVSACLLVLTALAVQSALPGRAVAGVTREAILCGYADDACDATTNYGWNTQRSITVEHSLTATGPYVWVGQAAFSQGWLIGDEPLNNTGGGNTEMHGLYTDPAGELGQEIRGLAFDPVTNTLFMSDTSNSRVLAFPRGDFSGAPVDYANPAQAPGPVSSPPATPGGADGSFSSISSPRGIAFSTFNSRLYAADFFNARVQIFSYTAGPTPSLTFAGKFSNGWDTDALLPSAIAVDPSDGHVFVADGDDDHVTEFEADGTFAGSVGGDATGSANRVWDVAVNEPDDLLYLVKDNQIDVYSLGDHRKLGTLPGGDFIASSSNYLVDVAIDPVGRDMYVVTSPTSGDDDNPPVAAYSLGPKPTCTVAAPITVTTGASVDLPLNCNDVDGGVQEFHRTATSPALGTLTPNADRTAITYKAGALPGEDAAQYRVVTMNGRSQTYSQPVKVVAAELPPPVVRQTANLQLESGDVYVRLPGSNEYVKLTADMQIPIGTIIDARAGKAHLTMANGDGTTSDGVFWDGIFQVLQGSGNKPITTMRLRDDLVPSANASIAMSAYSSGDPFAGARIAKKRGKKKNGLWGNAKGKYKTSGKGGSATVRGTIWYVADYQCGGLFKVKRGKVLVDPAVGKNFYLTAGKQRFVYYRKCKK